jgi:1-acyl-sn-glycerol-3-phosphate acyltransferase
LKQAVANTEHVQPEADGKEVNVYPEPLPYGALRGWCAVLWQQTLTWTFNALFLGLVCLLTVVTLGWFARRFSHFIMRTWGKAMLWITNVTLEIEPTDEITRERSRIVTYNHSSTLDIFIITVVGPKDAMPIIKKELLKVPFIGWTCKALGFVTLDRSNREKSVSSLQTAALQIKERNISVIIAPEGTRNGRRKLKQFKLGAFKMAHHGQLPIVPMVFEGAANLMPRGQNYSRKGTVRVRFLPDYAPDQLNPDDLISNANELRKIYEENLLEMMAYRQAEEGHQKIYPHMVD